MIIAPLLFGVEGGIFNYLQELNGSYSVPILAIILVGYLTKKIPGIAANIGIVFAVVTYLVTLYIIKPDISFLHVMGILFVLVIILMFIIGKIKPRAINYKQVYTEQVDITPWKYAKPVGLVICLAVVGLYIYFS